MKYLGIKKIVRDFKKYEVYSMTELWATENAVIDSYGNIYEVSKNGKFYRRTGGKI